MKENHFKRFLKQFVFRPGSVWPAYVGPLRGYRFEVSDATGLSFLYSGIERNNQSVILKNVRPKDVVMDAGANCGFHTLLLAKAVGAEGHVYAFEPLAQNCRDLRQNLALNHIGNVTIFEKALSSEEGVARFLPAASPLMGRFAKENEAATISVPTMTIDSMDLPRLDFIKMDIEGAEAQALTGARETLARCSPVILLELHGESVSQKCFAMLEQSGYNTARLDDKAILATPKLHK